MELPPAHSITAFRTRLLEWFSANARDFSWRKPGLTVFQMVIAEVLLQRTTAAAVARYMPAFLEQYPSWEAIAGAPDDELRASLKPFGLWERRFATLKPLASEMVKLGGAPPRDREQIEALPGVGQYIANAVLLLCHDQHEPLLDVNMARVLERYFGPRMRADIRYDPYLQALSRQAVEGEQPRAMNWAILDFGALVCRARNPLCSECPLANGCRFAREGLRRESDTAP